MKKLDNQVKFKMDWGNNDQIPFDGSYTFEMIMEFLNFIVRATVGIVLILGYILALFLLALIIGQDKEAELPFSNVLNSKRGTHKAAEKHRLNLRFQKSLLFSLQPRLRRSLVRSSKRREDRV